MAAPLEYNQVDASAALPSGLTVSTPSADLQSFPVLVDNMHARAHATHVARRDQIHQAGAAQDVANQSMYGLPREKPTL